jgi:hypothetical protein
MPITKSLTSTDNIRRVLYTCMVEDGDYKALLNELLAVIHRDGGQYTDLAGFAVSVEDAVTNVVTTRRLLAEHQQRAKR